MDTAVQTATLLTDTTNAPIYLRRTLRMRDADEFETIPET
jgi:hypothetical protein